MKHDIEKMSNHLKARRVIRKLSQEKMGKIIGVGKMAYCKKENNPFGFTCKELLDMKDYFETETIDEIFFTFN